MTPPTDEELVEAYGAMSLGPWWNGVGAVNADGLRSVWNAGHAECEKLEAELVSAITEMAESEIRALDMQDHLQRLEELFRLQQTRMDRATKAWQAAHNEPNVFPDLGKLLDWLMWEHGVAVGEFVALKCKYRRMRRLCKSRFETMREAIRSRNRRIYDLDSRVEMASLARQAFDGGRDANGMQILCSATETWERWSDDNKVQR